MGLFSRKAKGEKKKKPLWRRILKWTGITFLVLVLLIIAAPFIFQGKINNMVKIFINENLNAKVDFSDASLSFISSFPQANVFIDDLSITTFAPFEDEKLLDAKSLSFDFNIKELFKSESDGPIEVKEIYINEALLSLKSNKNGAVNWDIAKPKAKTINQPESDQNFTFKLNDYAIENSAFTYIDNDSNMSLYITDLDHSGHGTFSETVSELDTQSHALVTLKMDDTEYLSNNLVELDAVLGLDLENDKYTFKKNKLILNQLPIAFNGFVQLIENGQKIDISFKNEGATFKDFLAVLPKAYSKDLADVSTTGNFNVNGKVQGDLTEQTIPKLDVNILSNNASFKYNNLPKAVKNILINASVKNETGLADDTYVDIKTLNFKIDDDSFASSAKITNLTGNTAVNATINGVLNLANINKAYPIELDNDLTGVLSAKLNTNFDMNAIETNAYQRIKNNGNLNVKDFKYASADIVNPLYIKTANVVFNPGVVNLEQFNATSGKSDIYATGQLNNLLGFLLSDKKLQGQFNVNSNNFVVSDFMVEGDEASEKSNNSGTTKKTLKIPAFLDATINANAKTVYYDNLTLKDVKGELVIKDEKAELKNMTSGIFNGQLAINGLVNTKEDTPTFTMSLLADKFDIAKTFKDLEMFQKLAPIAKLLQGTLNSKIAINGKLGNDFAPDLSTINGDAIAKLFTTQVTPKK